jgi:beta-lactamase class A
MGVFDLTRRELLLTGAAVLAVGCAPGQNVAAPKRENDPFGDLEASIGGRVGVFALDTGSQRVIAHRADERFAMCSTFKWVLAACVLARVDKRELALEQRVAYGEADLLEHAPAARANVAAGAMTVDALAEAAVTVSDNTAANLLLALVGGPAGLTAFARGLGDDVTRLDRTEPTMNANTPGDPRDTTSPRAMVGTMKAVLVADVLSHASRDRLNGWLIACKTGLERLRAGLPAGYMAGDKTGTGENGAVNDVAIVRPPGRSPILIASYLSDGASDVARLSAAHAAIARTVIARLITSA